MSQDSPGQTRPLDDYLARPYHISLQRNNGKGWVAEVDELAGCTAEAATPDQAASEVHKAMVAWISAALAEGREIPAPRSVGSHSGRLLLRLPTTLHGELARAADREGASLNQFITGALAAAVGWRRSPEGAPSAPPALETNLLAATTDEVSEPGQGSRSRLVAVGLVANFIVVAIAAIVAVVLLIVAWQF